MEAVWVTAENASRWCLRTLHSHDGKGTGCEAVTIFGVAAVYQRHEFLKEWKQALELWGEHVQALSRVSVQPA
jgi:hypothetical protein